ncbi:MAG: aminoacyl-tRNA hydrolase [Lewinellaceae bacterium]|jgi:ribosome-associated protein|nr:aminoacyl-tRNA hydrolase [Lewinellaceae bacterium]
MDIELLKSELLYRTSRSGGKGGQNVNKVETKVEARFNVAASAALSEEEKALVLEKLANQVSGEGILSAVNQTERSQLSNKFLAEEKLVKLVEKALKKPKKRKPNRIPTAVKEARLEAKRRLSEKKAVRKGKGGNDE